MSEAKFISLKSVTRLNNKPVQYETSHGQNAHPDKPLFGEFHRIPLKINNYSEMKTCINSEFGKLEGVIIHQPGSEVENMTPENAERALYSDILNLAIASKE